MAIWNRVGGPTAGTILISLLTAGYGTAETSTPRATDELQASSHTYAFKCDNGQHYVVRTEGDVAWLFAPQGTHRLNLSTNEQALTFADEVFQTTIHDQEATIRQQAHQQTSCQNDRREAIWEHAKLNGADFRAVGNEPGWSLEIHPHSRIILLTDYGSRRIEQNLSAPVSDREKRITRWQGESIRVMVRGYPCTDNMSGERFETSVEVHLEGLVLRGCGRALH